MALSRHNDDVLIHNGVSVSHASRSLDSAFVAYVGKTCVFMEIPSSFFLITSCYVTVVDIVGSRKVYFRSFV
jgi:hypothetical protein